MGRWLFFWLFLFDWGFSPLLFHKTPRTPSWSFVVLPLTCAFTLEILGTGLSVKSELQLSRRMKDSPQSFHLPGRKHPLDGAGELVPAVPRAWIPFRARQGVPGHGFALGMVNGARRGWLGPLCGLRASRAGKSVSAARSSAWGNPCGDSHKPSHKSGKHEAPDPDWNCLGPGYALVMACSCAGSSP